LFVKFAKWGPNEFLEGIWAAPKKLLFLMFEGSSRVYVGSKKFPIFNSFFGFFFIWFFFLLYSFLGFPFFKLFSFSFELSFCNFFFLFLLFFFLQAMASFSSSSSSLNSSFFSSDDEVL